MLRFSSLVLLAVLAGAQAEEYGVAALVNDVEISNYRLDRYFADFLKAKARSVAAIRNPSSYKRLRREALDQLIDKELLWQEAQRRGIDVSDALVQRELESIKASFSSPEAYQRQLLESGFDEASYLGYLRREMVAGRMLNLLVQPLTVSDEEVRQAYEARRDSFRQAEQVSARHILLRVPANADAAAERTAHERIAALREQLVNGADFAELARSHSEDPSAARGGDLGYFSRGQMVPSFEQTAFALTPGAISPPVRSEFGWHLIRVDEHVAAGEIDEEVALATVREQLLYQRFVMARDVALERLRGSNRIVVRNGP